VIKVIEHDGTAPVAQDYDAFGAADGAVAKNGPGFNGAPSVDGFQYLRNRWYDPNVGRFTQEDPIGFAGGINLYAYAGSNPVSSSDPFGLLICFRGASHEQDKCDDPDATRLWDETYAAGNDSVKAQMDLLRNSDLTYGLVFGPLPQGSDERYGSSGPSTQFSGGVFTIDTHDINLRRDYADARFVLAHEVGHAQNGRDRNHTQIINYFENPVRRALGFIARDPILVGVDQLLNKLGRRFP
jgi:RHS repeat-associated protein